MAATYLAQGDVIQAVIESDVAGQVCLNVLHYVVQEDLPGYDYRGGLLLLQGAIETNPLTGIIPKMHPMMGGNTSIVRMQMQRVYPTRDFYIREIVGQDGTAPEDCQTANMAAVITKQSETAGRGRSGSFHLAGIPEGNWEAGRLTAGYFELLEDLAARVASWQYGTADAPGFLPYLFNPNVAYPTSLNKVVGAFAQNTLRVMRRRTVGVGI